MYVTIPHHPHPTDTKTSHKKQQQQNNNQQKQRKNPQNKKITPKRSFDFKCLRKHDCSIHEIISSLRYIEVPWLSLLPPQPPPPE